MFSLKDFIKSGLIQAIGKMADYQIILNAVGWYEKNVLEENDLVEIQTMLEIKNNINSSTDVEAEEIIEEEGQF